MTCNVQPLIDFDVFDTKKELDNGDTFVVSSSCRTIAQPFEQYCLIPPAARLVTTSTCSAIQTNALNPNYIFPKITQGLVQTLDDLPIVYVSFPEITDTKQIWIADPSVNPNRIIDFASLNYVGFRPVTSVVSFAVSSAQLDVALLIAITDVEFVYVYVKDSFGIFRPQVDIFGNILSASASNLEFQKAVVATNVAGTLQFALLGSKVYRYDANIGGWMFVVAGALDLVVADEFAIACNSQSIEFIWRLPSSIAVIGKFLWQCLSYDRKWLYVYTYTSPTDGFLYSIDCVNRNVLAVLSVTLPSPPTTTQSRISAIAVTPPAATFVVLLVTDGSGIQPVQQFMILNNAVVFVTTYSPTTFVTRFYNDVCWFDQTANQVVFYDGTRIAASSSDMSQQTFLAVPSLLLNSPPNEFRVWAFVQGQLVTTTKSSQGIWTNDFNLYMPTDARLSDMDDKPWYYAPSIDPPWYLGVLSAPVPTSFSTLPAVFRVSRHQRYRWVFDSIVHATQDSFGHIITHLERINDYYLLSNLALFETRLYENALITVTDVASNNDVFVSNTPDQSSDKFSFQTITDLNVPCVTNNGLYVFYTKTNTVDNSRYRVLCYNAFNSSQFANWCNNSQLQTRALNQQSEFCMQNLSMSNGDFLDPRCNCIPNPTLFSRMFPGVFQTEGLIASRVVQNLPCLSGKCAKVFLLGNENSNVLNYATANCKQDLVLCASFIEAKGTVAMRSLLTQQNCGDKFTCKNNNECPIDSICFNGDCIPRCDTDVYCKTKLNDPLATCDTIRGICLFDAKSSPAKRNWVIFAVCMLVAAFLMLVVLITVFVSPSKKNA